MTQWIGALRKITLGLVSAAVAQLALAADVLPQAEAPFKGKIGWSVTQSTPDWPQAIKAPQGAPNVVVILLDDIGFAETSSFGGVAQTPEIDRIAAQGLRYINFNTTSLCSPSRAALLSGRNHHRVGFGSIADGPGGYPGYNSIWKDNTASIAAVLRERGYSTAAFGKWHNTPDWEITPVGPFNHWPTGLGFEYFYGFMGPSGEENQWYPTRLYRNTTPVDAPATPVQGYHLTTDLTNEAIRWMTQHQAFAPGKPFFLYFATGAVHAPHQAPREWIDRYRGQFDTGWDRLNAETFKRQKQLGVVPPDARLTPRPKEVPAWDSLSADEKKLYARQMEVYAGFVAHTDHEVGRLLQAIRSGPGSDNTLVIYVVGDNGAEIVPLSGYDASGTSVTQQLQHLDLLGGPQMPTNTYSIGWAWAGDTPFQYWKSVASHFGGLRDPMIVSWPARIKKVGEIRGQFTHITDIAATIYDVTGVSPPARLNGVEQQPLDGVSFAQTFDSATTPSAHRTQYFEMIGSRSIYQDGWVAAARHLASSWHGSREHEYSKDRWELYHVATDFSEAQDLSRKYPDKLRQLQLVFDQEARKNDVYPLGGAFTDDEPSQIQGRREFVYSSRDLRVPFGAVPDFARTSYRISTTVSIPVTGAQGVLVSQGDRYGGFTWYIKDDHLVYENRGRTHHETMTSSVPIPSGDVRLAFEFHQDSAAVGPDDSNSSAGTGYLYIDDQLVGEMRIPSVSFGGGAYTASLYLGRDGGSPVSDAYTPPFRFTGSLEKVAVRLQ